MPYYSCSDYRGIATLLRSDCGLTHPANLLTFSQRWHVTWTLSTARPYFANVELVAFIVFGLYILLIGFALLGWLLSASAFDPTFEREDEKISVVIPARNEAHNIPPLLSDLAEQSYHNFEVIVVDDHSSDGTADVARGTNLPNLTVLQLTDGEGKKAAITEGIMTATGSLILTTDADCRMGHRWIETMSAHYAYLEPKMLLGPVAVEGRGLLGAFQAIDMFVLMLFTCAAARFRKPILANGANLLFAKTDFEEVGGFAGYAHISSGDDVLLMQKFAKRFGSNSIRFVKSQEAIVRTKAQRNVKQLVAQRVRWLSKRGSMGAPARFLMVLVYVLVVAFLGILGFYSLNQDVFMGANELPLMVAAGVTMAGLLIAASFFRRMRYMVWLPVVLTIYPVYVAAIPIIALFSRPAWKGRPVKS